MTNDRIGQMAAALTTIIMLCSGCTTFESNAPRVPMGYLNFAPLSPDEYEILGNAEGTASVGHFLFFPFGDYNLYGSLGGGGTGFFGSGSSRGAAMYKAIESVPGADALLAVRSKSEGFEMILFGQSKTTVKGKAIKILKK